MATGSCKTIAALVAAHRLFEGERPILLVVAVPYLPLVSQWSDESRKFDLAPFIPGNESSRTKKLSRIRHVVRNLMIGISDIECIVITHDFLCDPGFQEELDKYSGVSMLIADEVHNLGTPSFLQRPPTGFNYRLGLSATTIRQYDDVGTEELMEYLER